MNPFQRPPICATVTASPSDFEVQPEEQRCTDQETSIFSFQHKFQWSISPQRPGDWHLHIDLNRLDWHPARTTQFLVNGKDRETPDSLELDPQVTVVTRFGVTRRTYELTKYGFAIVAFALMYPAVLRHLQGAPSRAQT